MRTPGKLKIKIIDQPFGSEVIFVDEKGNEYSLSHVKSVAVKAEAGERPVATLVAFIESTEYEFDFLASRKAKMLLSKIRKERKLSP